MARVDAGTVIVRVWFAGADAVLLQVDRLVQAFVVEDPDLHRITRLAPEYGPEFSSRFRPADQLRSLIFHIVRIAALLTGCIWLLIGCPSAEAKADKAKYIGGTLTNPLENTDFEFDTTGETVAVLAWKKHKSNPAGSLELRYKGIESIEYGQKAGRRVGVAIAITPLALFSKKRKHFVTLTYLDSEGRKQGIVIELGKGDIRRVLTILEARSGKPIEYESAQRSSENSP